MADHPDDVGRLVVILTAVAAACATFTPGARADTVPPACERPYAADSPWNTPVAPDAPVDPHSALRVGRIGAPLTSDPTQYTYPVYAIDATTPRAVVRLDGWLSAVGGDGGTLVNQRAGTVELPLPAGASAAAGYDRQIVLLDPATGEEWGASYLEQLPDGTYTAWNAYRYNTAWSGVPPRDANGDPFFARGAGVPYLAGLVRRCEIERGRIEHALAFAYPTPRGDHVWPATKSDGESTDPRDLPEGTRLQLDPALDDGDLAELGCLGACRTIAHALQEYGMILIDGSGRPKVMLEYDGTARWSGRVGADTVSPIPIERFRVVGDVPGRDPDATPVVDWVTLTAAAWGVRVAAVAHFRVAREADVSVRCRARRGGSSLPLLRREVGRAPGGLLRVRCIWPGRRARVQATVSVSAGGQRVSAVARA